ncbi:DUF4259 domain-containing protein [Streptomyces sp. NPDC093991]
MRRTPAPTPSRRPPRAPVAAATAEVPAHVTGVRAPCPRRAASDSRPPPALPARDRNPAHRPVERFRARSTDVRDPTAEGDVPPGCPASGARRARAVGAARGDAEAAPEETGVSTWDTGLFDNDDAAHFAHDLDRAAPERRAGRDRRRPPGPPPSGRRTRQDGRELVAGPPVHRPHPLHRRPVLVP